MKRTLGTSLMLVLGGIALLGACELETPAISDRDREIVDEVEAHPPLESRCGDCRDGKSDTYDWCDPYGECKHKKRWKCEDEDSDCDRHGDCKDGDSDTVDWCYKSSCHHADRYTGKCEY